MITTFNWLVSCFGFNGPLRQYFSLYWAVSQREGEREEKGQMRVKMSKKTPPAPTASAAGPCPTVIQIVGRPGTGSLPSTFAPPDHPPQHSILIGCGASIIRVIQAFLSFKASLSMADFLHNDLQPQILAKEQTYRQIVKQKHG